MRDIGELSRVVQISSAARDYTLYVKALLAARGRPEDAFTIARTFGASSRLQQIIKSPVVPGSTDNTTWGGSLVAFREAVAGFVGSLAPYSSFDRLLSDNAFTKMPLKTRIVLASSGVTASVVPELGATPIGKMSFSQSFLPDWKIRAVVVLSDELAHSVLPEATSLFEIELKKAVGLATDEQFLTVLLEGTGIATASSSGLDAASFLSDLATAMRAVETDANSKLYLILPPAITKIVATMRDSSGFIFGQMTPQGGAIQGVKVIASSAATDFGVVLDATAIGASSDEITIDIMQHASIQLTDTPTSGVAELVNLWQQKCVALTAKRTFGAKLLRSNGIAVIDGFSTTA